MAQPLKPIECSAQPLSISFHPFRDIVAAGLVDGTVEVHDLIPKSTGAAGDKNKKSNSNASGTMDDDEDMATGSDNESTMDKDDDDEADTILSSIYVAKQSAQSKQNTKMLAKLDDEAMGGGSNKNNSFAMSKAVQEPSCRCVLFSRSPHESNSSGISNNDSSNGVTNSSGDFNCQSGGEYLFTACNGGSLRCLDTELACSIDHSLSHDSETVKSPAILWSIENAHAVGINKLYQLPYSSPCGPLLVTGDDVGTIRLWDITKCADNHDKDGKIEENAKQKNPFDNLMRPPKGCVMHWKVNHDYITDFETSNDGSTLFATSADGTLSVFDLKFVQRSGTPRSVIVADIDPKKPDQPPPSQANNNKKSTWETSGYSQSDNQEDELLSVTLIKNSQKLLCGSQQGILSLFSYNVWGDISDRFPGHPNSIDAILKIDEDTVLTGSSDGLVRAVQLLPNSFLGVLGGHDGFPVEYLGWSAGRKMVGSISHDDYIRLWDASFLKEDDDDDDIDCEGEANEEGRGVTNSTRPAQGLGVSTMATSNNSDDEWEDMDEEDENMSDDDDDDDNSDSDDSNEMRNQPKKREKIFKTANEEFFQDL